MILMDPKAKRVGEKENMTASLLSLTGNIPGVLYWKMNKILDDKKVDVKVSIFWQTFIQTVLYIILATQLDGASLFDMSNTGVFGFLRSDNAFFCIFIFSFIVGFWACAGYVWALMYFNPLIVMNCLLIEPLSGQVVGVLMNIDEIPGFLTWIGVFFVLIAINVLRKGKQITLKESLIENDDNMKNSTISQINS